jgi:hypothetical protein
MGIAQIEPLGLGVQLQEAPSLQGRLDRPLHIQLVRSAPADHPSGRMGQDVEVRIVHRTNHPLRLLVGRQVELGVN